MHAAAPQWSTSWCTRSLVRLRTLHSFQYLQFYVFSQCQRRLSCQAFMALHGHEGSNGIHLSVLRTSRNQVDGSLLRLR